MDKLNKDNKETPLNKMNKNKLNKMKTNSNKSPSPVKKKLIEDSRTSDNDKSTKSNSNSNSNSKSEKLLVENWQRLPKNVNEYRHIIDTRLSRDSDVEWILELRAYNAKRHYESLKASQGSHPDIYLNSIESYRSKVDKELKEKKNNLLLLKGNSRDFEHLMLRKIGMPSNPCQLGFDSTLRTFVKDKTCFENSSWKTLALSPKKSLLSLYLPPMNRQSIENLDKIKDVMSRPYEQFEDKTVMNGQKIRQRKFLPSKIMYSNVAGENNSSPLYTLKYSQKNIGDIRHMLEQQNNSVGLWETDLRSYPTKRIKKSESKTIEK